MTKIRSLAVALTCAVVAAASLQAGDVSRYRDFRMGAGVIEIAGLARLDPAQAKVVHRRPALIEELQWSPQPLGPSTGSESVRQVVFSFYNNELYRIIVRYDPYKTEGLTEEDLIEAVSPAYGTAGRTAAEIVLPSLYGNEETLPVLARWEDAEHSFSLVRFSSEASYTLVGISKRLDALARSAAGEAARLDAAEAPQRELDLQKKQQADARAQQEKARSANKPGFRP